MTAHHPSRRQFLAGGAALVTGGLSASEALACRWRHRACYPPPWCYPVLPPLPPPPPFVPPLRVRRNIDSFTPDEVNSLKRGVARMKALPASDPRSWRFQANIHGTKDSTTNPLFNQCEHKSLRFLAWHRAYLHFFERILRWAAGDRGLNLPYWDWTASPALPLVFRSPALSGNPLFDRTRKPEINGGGALEESVVVWDLGKALDFPTFPPDGPVGFSRSLEGSPHGAVHDLIGGNMGEVETAANDPVFWLHHGNIDRLWDRWLNLGGGRVNPSDDAFLNTAYSFADESGRTVTVRVRDVLGSAPLGYRYDNVPTPASRPAAPGPAVGAGRPVLLASSEMAEAPREGGGKPLGFKPERVTLRVAPKGARLLREAAAAARAAPPGKLLLRVEGLSYAAPPGFVYAVYLNLPGKADPARAKLHHVGTVSFFGKGRSGARGHGHAGTTTFTETFDVTGVVARLHARGLWEPDKLSVTLRPVTPVPPRGEEEGVRKRAERSAAKAKITYRRVTLLGTP